MSYFIKHWKGQLSPRKTFYINALLLTYFLPILINFFPTFSAMLPKETVFDFIILSADLAILFGGVLAILTWQHVGLVRCCYKHYRKTKSLLIILSTLAFYLSLLRQTLFFVGDIPWFNPHLAFVFLFLSCIGFIFIKQVEE